MRRALALARRGLQGVSPNPMVGAVLVRRGKVIAEGYHRRFGGPHAEVEALRRAGDARGADLYVTLEPCGHYGKTPPCAAAILAAGVRRVIYGASDPNPETAGRGPRALRAAGLEVVRGFLEKECVSLNAPYFYWRETGLPWVILKWAMTLDGKIATGSGESQWITGEEARAQAHALRRRVDAVMVGTRTLLRDDPLLLPKPARGRTPVRVILDRRGRLPLSLRLLGVPAQSGDGPRLYVAGPDASDRRLRELASRGLEILRLKANEWGLLRLLRELGRRGISQLLVEGGSALLGSFVAARSAQEVAAFVAPRLLGGRDALGAVGGPGLEALARTPWLERPGLKRLGRDILIQGRLRWPPE